MSKWFAGRVVRVRWIQYGDNLYSGECMRSGWIIGGNACNSIGLGTVYSDLQ